MAAPCLFQICHSSVQLSPRKKREQFAIFIRVLGENVGNKEVKLISTKVVIER